MNNQSKVVSPAKHLDGQWKRGETHLAVDDSGDMWTHIQTADVAFTVVTPPIVTKPEATQLAMLLAAAPELLEALREITERYEQLDTRLVAGQHSEPNGTISRAKAAITRATKP